MYEQAQAPSIFWSAACLLIGKLPSVMAHNVVDDRPGITATLDLLAMTSNMCGHMPDMITYYERAIPILRELNDHQTLSSSLTNRGLVTLDQAPAFEASSTFCPLRW